MAETRDMIERDPKHRHRQRRIARVRAPRQWNPWRDMPYAIVLTVIASVAAWWMEWPKQ